MRVYLENMTVDVMILIADRYIMFLKLMLQNSLLIVIHLINRQWYQLCMLYSMQYHKN